MKVQSQLDIGVVALDVDDEVTVMVDLEAPNALPGLPRPVASLEVVLDRSGSMAGAPLEGAKEALVSLVRQLDPSDNFGLVVFDHEAEVVVAAQPIADKEEVIRKIRGVAARGSTDLGAGLLRGLRDIKRVTSSGATVLIISDGHVNAGLQDVARFAGVAAKAHADGVVISTLGYGEHYDESLLSAIARAGTGNHVFAADLDAAAAAVAGEVDGLLSKTAQAVTLTLDLESAVDMVRFYNDLPTVALPEGRIMIELGDLFADEKRRLLIKLKVPGRSELGETAVAELGIEYVALPGLVEHRVTIPVVVNVVPGSEAARRLVHPLVESEKLFQDAQESKRLASEGFEQGDVDSARSHLLEAKRHLASALQIAPAGSVAEIQKEAASVERMRNLATQQSTEYMSKLSRSSFHEMNRKRGRDAGPAAS